MGDVVEFRGHEYSSDRSRLVAFNSHKWGMRKIHSNHRGEPVYLSMCETCGRSSGQAWEDRSECTNDGNR